MAVLKAPLLSLDARGQLGKAIVFSGWKGIKVARQHVVPANPNTADQQTQRGYVTSCVSARKNYLTNTGGRAAWDRAALNATGAMSGFNLFMRNAIGMIASDPDASFVDLGAPVGGEFFSCTTKNLDDGAVGDEAGNFEIWAGSTISGMVLIDDDITIAGGNLTSTDLGDVGDVMYVKVRKDSFDRSGIYRITLE